jgi:uncharacterized protein YkwD
MRRALQTARTISMALALSACSFPLASPTPIFPPGPEPASGATLTPFLPQPAVFQDAGPPATGFPTGQAGLGSPTPTLLGPPAPATAAVWLPANGTPHPATLEAYYRRSVLLPVAEAIVHRVNRDRAMLGMPGLIAPPAMMEIAFIRAEDLVARTAFDHAGPDGSSPAQTLMVAAGFGGHLAENLYACVDPLGQVADSTVAAWMSSPEHREVILDPRFQYMGVGLMGDGTWWKVVQVFAQYGP